MDAKTLRASILQMAIEGKLVPQLNEEPAVEQIGDAPEEVPFEIPGKWKWCRLKHLGILVTGNTPSTSNRCYYGHDIPFIKPDAIGYDSCVRYKKEGLSNVGRAVAKIVPPKSLLMVCIGGSIGKVAIINNEVAFNQQINAICCNSSVVSVEYLLNVMSSSYFQNTVRANATGTATPIINKSKWGNIFIPIPPLTLQHRIVARLNELLPLVDKFGKAQEALAVAQKEFPEKLKASLLQEAIRGKLVPQLDEEPAVEQIGEAPEDVPFAIPEKWKWFRLSLFASKRSTVEPSSLSDTKVQLLSIPAYDAGAPEILSPKSIGSSKKQVQEGDILVSKIVPHISRAWIVPKTDLKSLASTEWMVFSSNGCYTKYLRYIFLSNEFKSQMLSTVKGMGSLKRANPSEVAKIFIPIPPLNEQRRIVARLNELLPLVDRMAAQVTTGK